MFLIKISNEIDLGDYRNKPSKFYFTFEEWINDGIWKPRKIILYRLSLHAIRLSPNSSICCLKCFWKYGEITNSNFVKSHLHNALWYYCIKLKWTVWCLLYLKSSISGVRSWTSLEESQKAADPAELIGALLPMDVPTAENN